uniref:Uncharacterized protein n=1 Tax=Helianthus annuus TaxID=4232 RepID=A0A251S0R1_HELAN
MKNIPLSWIKYFRSPFRKQEHTPYLRLSLEETPSKNRKEHIPPIPPAGSNLKETPSKNRKEHIPHSRFSLEEAPSKNMK